MATFDHKEIVDQIIALNGQPDPEDGPHGPRAVKVVQYDNAFGGTCWGVVYRNYDGSKLEAEDRYEQPTYFVRNPKVIWELESGVR
jgi:hypothetical protein